MQRQREPLPRRQPPEQIARAHLGAGHDGVQRLEARPRRQRLLEEHAHARAGHERLERIGQRVRHRREPCLRAEVSTEQRRHRQHQQCATARTLERRARERGQQR